ncbi:hypothetical protein ACOZDZ_17995 [Streptomyces griseoincarnatus]|nr:hypothetical protein [Streptomyces sp. E2N171]
MTSEQREAHDSLEFRIHRALNDGARAFNELMIRRRRWLRIRKMVRR